MAALAAVLVLWVLIWYFDSVAAATAIWLRSETYAHGMLIVPVSLYLIWRKRREIAALDPAPSWLGMLLLAAAGMGWLAARLADVDAAQQFMVVVMIIAVVWALLGQAILRVIWFPLLFLFLAVPFGDFLLAPLMSFTADFTVLALRATGIPVFREGNLFTIPSGSWSVVEACSGLRYLIASFTLGALFAYINYRSAWRRLIFVTLALILPIIANGVRAYLIVMIGHLSGMKFAVGVDHLIYGWLFFGVVMLFLFWIGSLWPEREAKKTGSQPNTARAAGSAIWSSKLAPVALGIAAVSAAWPVFAARVAQATRNHAPVLIDAPTPAGDWRATDPTFTEWRPHYFFAKADLVQGYASQGGQVLLHVKYYRDQRQDAELVNALHEIVPTTDKIWGRVASSTQRLSLSGRSLDVVETSLRSQHQQLMVWHWYRIGTDQTSSNSLAKLLQAKAKLLTQSDDAVAIFLAAPYDTNADQARVRLRAFVEAMGPAIETALDRAAHRE